ncbi:MAG: lactate utilization protein [Geminicoccaceae bacterium]|nr:lactate utilization protein [Geminicoccaceae bacterium]
MTGARDAVMGRVNKALERGDGAEARARGRVAAWLADPEPNLIPRRGLRPHEGRVGLFREMAERVQADVARVPRWRDAPAAVARYLRDRNLPQKAVMAPDRRLDRCDWESQPLLRLSRGTALGRDEVGITLALGGVAETGTLVLASAPERPTMLAYLPETCVVLLATSRIQGDYEAAWRALGHELDRLPRSVNLITGPSRTADIAQELQLGAHGPKRLCIVLVDEPEA